MKKNLPSILTLIPKIQGISEEDMEDFFNKLDKNGIYKTEDMLAIDDKYVSLVKNGKYSERCKLWADPKTYAELNPENKKKIEGIKIFLDGALGPETAATRGYVSGKKGLLLYSDDELQSILNFISEEKLPLAIHSVGELGIERLLNIIKINNFKIPYIRIEHAMFITEDIATQCKNEGPHFINAAKLSFDSLLFKGKLTDEHLAKNNPFRMLIDKVGYIPGENLFFQLRRYALWSKSCSEKLSFPSF